MPLLLRAALLLAPQWPVHGERGARRPESYTRAIKLSLSPANGTARCKGKRIPGSN